MKNALKVIITIFLLATITTNAASKQEIHPDTIKLKQGYSLHVSDIYIDIDSPIYLRTATLQLIHGGVVIDSMDITTNAELGLETSFSLYDGTELIVKGEDVTIFRAEPPNGMVHITYLTQYNKKDVIIYQNDINTKINLWLPLTT